MSETEIFTGADAQANVASQPANILLYGVPGTLKTTDAVEAFIRPDGSNSAFVIPCEDGALKTIASRGWTIPDHFATVKSWGQMERAFAYLAKNRDRYTGLVIDGLSPFSVNLYQQATEALKGKNKFDIPLAVRTCLFTLRDWIRLLGLHTVLVAHAAPPTVQEGIFYPGCFELAPKTVTRLLFGQIDTVLRIDYISPNPGQPLVRVYHTGGASWPTELGQMSQPADRHQWLAKNREGVNQAVVPANLRAFLQARRPPYAGI